MKRLGRGVADRRVAKWAGLVVCLPLAAAWCVSIGSLLRHEGVLSSEYSWHVTAGALVLIHSDPPLSPSLWDFQAVDPQVQWWPPWRGYPYLPSAPSGGWFVLPLWWPFVLVDVPTAWLWWQDRRRPGYCPACGYDLAGLAPGAACPECGKAD